MSDVYGQCARCGGSLTADHKCSVFSTEAVFGTCEHGQLKRSCNICELEATIAALRAEVAELRKDSERYRWLQSHGIGRHFSGFWTYKTDLDKEIDAAIDAEKEK